MFSVTNTFDVLIAAGVTGAGGTNGRARQIQTGFAEDEHERAIAA